MTSEDAIALGQQALVPSAFFRIPSTLPVVRGSAGDGVAVLSLTQDSAGQGAFSCTYTGRSEHSHPVTLEDKLRGASYYFESCTNGMLPHQVVHLSALSLHVESGDCESGQTTAVLNQYTGQAPMAVLIPPDQVPVSDHGSPVPISLREPPVPDAGVPAQPFGPTSQAGTDSAASPPVGDPYPMAGNASSASAARQTISPATIPMSEREQSRQLDPYVVRQPIIQNGRIR